MVHHLVKVARVELEGLHVVDGELPDPKLPLIPGHEIVGRVVECGAQVTDVAAGTRVGVPWLGSSCGECPA